jgi:PPM family protein phosphatase
MEWTSVLSLGAGSVRLTVSAASDVGNVRAINEDSFLAGPAVFLVADGMGGHAHGDRASAEVVRIFTERQNGDSTASSSLVLNAIAAANMAVRGLTPASAEDVAIAGTTLTGIALIQPELPGPATWMAFNVGDSRTYAWSGDTLTQITVDHSAVQELGDLGRISRAEADIHPERNIVTRAMGVDDEPDADVWLIPAGGEQLFVMCSDGLTKELSDERIAELIRSCADPFAPNDLAARLVSAAIAAGGNDNVTVVAVGAIWASDDSGVAAPMPAFLEETAPRI